MLSILELWIVLAPPCQSLTNIMRYNKNNKNIAQLALVPPQSTLTHILRNSKLFQYYKYHKKNWVSRSVNCIVASTCRHWQIFFPASVLNTLLWRQMQDIIWNMGGHILELSRQNAAVLYFSVNWDVNLDNQYRYPNINNNRVHLVEQLTSLITT